MKNITNQVSFRNLYAFGEKKPIDLSLSENPLGMPPLVKKLLKNIKIDFSDYPDPDSKNLKFALSNKFALNPSNFFIANGSEAIIKILPMALLKKNDQVIIPNVTFPMFKIACLLNDNKIIFSRVKDNFQIDIDDIKMRINSKTKMIIMCNPNTPTGLTIKKANIIELLKSTKAFVVIDEANIEFDGQSIIDKVNNFPNLIILRSFSKGFGLAGARIGFCASNNNIVKKLERISPLFLINSLSQKIAITALEDKQFIKKTKKFMQKETNFLQQELKKRDFQIISSNANNFILNVKPFAKNGTDFVKKLNKLEVSVVDGIYFGKRCVNFVRVSPRLRKTNLKFLSAIDKLLSY